MMKTLSALVLLSTIAAPLAFAADVTPVAIVDVDRAGVELRERLTAPPDVDVWDSAIVMSNRSPERAVVFCHGFNHNGAVVGRVRLQVPANGLRFVLTSDFGNDRDFLGRVDCITTGQGVIGSAFLLGNGNVETLPVDAKSLRRLQTMTFPVTLTR